MAFNSNNYRLKYFHVHTDMDGQTVRLEIYVKSTGVVRSKEIGDLCGLSLEVQGSQNEVDTAIVKTSLRFSLIDSYDKPDTITKKYGNWQEFYTPDSTQYLVKLKTMASGESTYTTRWSGYITPDSWQESLDYYGTVTITARDNVGHLQDFDFDAEGDDNGLKSIEYIVASGMDKIDMPMSVVWDTLDILGHDWHELKTSDSPAEKITDLKLNVDVFKGKNWYETIETILGDIGYVMRWTDNNNVVITPLRNMYLLGEGDEQAIASKQIVFLDGTKTLNPAYKSMTDKISYDFEQTAEYDVKKGLSFTGDTTSYPFSISYYDEFYEAERTYYGDSICDNIAVNNGIGWSGSGFYNLDGYTALAGVSNDLMPDFEIKDVVALSANNFNTSTHPNAVYNFGAVRTNSLKVKVNFSAYSHKISDEDESGAKTLEAYFSYIINIRYLLVYSKDGTNYYWNATTKKWVTSSVTNSWTPDNTDDYTQEMEIDISTHYFPASGGGNLILYFDRIEYRGLETFYWGDQYKGVTMIVKSIGLELVGSNIESNTLTTKPEENANYNILNVKDCTIGPLSAGGMRFINNRTYKNVLYKNAFTLAPYKFKWEDQSTAYPLPLLIHTQRLAYHGTTKAIIEGQARVADGSGFRINQYYVYKGVTYLLVSGTLDLVTGQMDVTLYQL